MMPFMSRYRLSNLDISIDEGDGTLGCYSQRSADCTSAIVLISIERTGHVNAIDGGYGSTFGTPMVECSGVSRNEEAACFKSSVKTK